MACPPSSVLRRDLRWWARLSAFTMPRWPDTPSAKLVSTRERPLTWHSYAHSVTDHPRDAGRLLPTTPRRWTTHRGPQFTACRLARPPRKPSPPGRRRSAHDSPRAHRLAHHVRRLIFDAPQRERQSNRTPAVQVSSHEPRRPHHEHHVTSLTPIATQYHLTHHRRFTDVGGSADLSSTKPVTLEVSPAVTVNTRYATSETAFGPSQVHVGRQLLPFLDVEIEMNESSVAPWFRQDPRGARRDRGCYTLSVPSPFDRPVVCTSGARCSSANTATSSTLVLRIHGDDGGGAFVPALAIMQSG